MVEHASGRRLPVDQIKVPAHNSTDSSSENSSMPPIPIGAEKISDLIPYSKIRKNPQKILPVEAAVRKTRIKKAPQLTTRVIEEDGFEEEYEGLLFTYKRRPTWFIIPPEKKIPPLDEPFYLNGARSALARRQDKSRPIPPTPHEIRTYLEKHPDQNTHLRTYDVAHDAQEIFTLAAWHWLRNYFLEDEIPPDEITPSLCYREVYLNNYGVVYDRKPTADDGKVAVTCGQVDIYGTLPDNQGVIIDFGSFSRDKELQTLRQYHGMQAVIQETNHDQAPPMTTYIGEYFKDKEGVNIIHLKSSRNFSDYIDPTNKSNN